MKSHDISVQPKSAPSTTKEHLWDRNFILLLAGSSVSTAGDSITFIVFGFLAYSTTQSTALYSLSLICHFLPGILVSLVSGPIVDRSNPVRVMVYADIFRAIAIFVFVLVYSMYEIDIWGILTLAFFNGLAEAWFSPASKALTVRIIHKKNLAKSLGILNGFDEAIELAFKGIGGFLVATLKPLALLVADGMSFVASAVSESSIKPEKAEPSVAKSTTSSFLNDCKDGFNHVFKRPDLKQILYIQGFLSFFAIPGYVLLLPMLSNSFDNGVELYGLALSALALGNVAGSLGYSKHSFLDRYHLLLGSILGFSAIWAIVASLHSLEAIIVLILVLGFFQSISRITLQSVWLERLDSRYVGRASSIQSLIFSTLIPVGIILSGLLGELFSPTDVLTCAYLACFLISAVILWNRGTKNAIRN